MTARDALSSVSAYPIPAAFLASVGMESGLDMDCELADVPARPMNRAKARVYLYLATAPNITEGGVSITLGTKERELFMGRARKFAALAGEDGLVPGPAYGYKGENI